MNGTDDICLPLLHSVKMKTFVFFIQLLNFYTLRNTECSSTGIVWCYVKATREDKFGIHVLDIMSCWPLDNPDSFACRNILQKFD